MKRILLSAALLAGLAMLIGCGSNTEVGSIAITPSTQSLAAGQTAQFTATGTIPHGKHPATNEDVTNQVTWTSNAPAIATISSTGVATAVSAGTATITASMAGATSATATMTVTGTSGATNNDVVSLSVTPSTQTVASPSATAQFLAIGTTGSGATLDVTSQVAWSSSSTSVAIISKSGLATGQGKGTTTITAIYTNADKTVANASAAFTVNAGTTEQYTDLTVTPNTATLAAGGQQKAQLLALATSGSTGLKADVTSQVNWSTSVAQIATVSATGQVTGVSPGNAVITAQWTNPDKSVVSASATVTVSNAYISGSLLSLTIIPSAISVLDLQDTGNFVAIGTYSDSPFVRDVTNQVTWMSSFPDDFPVSSNSGGTPSAAGGIVTAYASGSATIIAEATGPDGTIQTATATFSCPLVLPDPNSHPPTAGSCYQGQFGPLKATLTVYGEGLNVTTPPATPGNWLITAPSATATPDVIHCGPGWAADGNDGGSVCTGIYPNGTKVLLTAPARKGVAFGGWTYNCTPTDASGNPLPGPVFWTEDGPNYCTVSLVSIDGGSVNATVGAIFNNK